MTIKYSFLIPTRNRVPDLIALLDSIKSTTRAPGNLEIVLGVDEDDQATRDMFFDGLNIKKTFFKPGLTMGAMNNACLAASTGKYVMLMNDDMLIRTDGWDVILEQVLESIRDDIFLCHINDLLFGEKLCCFPMVSRTYCEIANGICPDYYERYRIDDHIYHVFNLLAQAGHRRIYYFPEVVFEHLNFEVMSSGDKAYLYDKPTLDRDAYQFDLHLEERKSLAEALAKHINATQTENIRIARAKVFDGITDSKSSRRPEHVRKISTADVAKSNCHPRVTIGLVCSDIRHPHTQTCLSLIKAHTSNYELVVLDNSRDPNFNHPREMNRLLEFTRNKQLVLLDDDVYVEPGWLEDMQAAATSTVGCVTPIHKDAAGHRSYAGVYVGLDDNGEHGHLLEVSDHPISVPTICSAAMLIDMDRCGHLRFDESCLKYFHDLDFGLQVWETGSKVVCNTKVPITHLGGATLKQGSTSAQAFVERDRQFFVARWLKSGRLRQLRDKSWRDIPSIDSLYSIPEAFSSLLSPSIVNSADWKKDTSALVEKLNDIPSLRTTFVSKLKEAMFSPSHPLSTDISLAYRWLRTSIQNGADDSKKFAQVKRKIAELVERWKAEKKRVVVYPAGSHTSDLFRATSLLQANIVGLGDSNQMIEGDEMWGKLVVSPSSLAQLRPDIILISSPQFENEIWNSLHSLLPAQVELVRLYSE